SPWNSTRSVFLRALLPTGEDAFVLGLRSLCRRLRRLISTRDAGEHRGDDPGVKRFGDARCCVAWVANVGRPLQNVAQNLVLVWRICTRIVSDFLLQVGHGLGETGEVVELPGDKAVVEVIHVVDQELLCEFFVLGKLPDD